MVTHMVGLIDIGQMNEHFLILYHAFPYVAWSALIVACWVSQLFPSFAQIFSYGKLAPTTGTTTAPTKATPTQAQTLSTTPHEQQPQQVAEQHKPGLFQKIMLHRYWYTSHSFGFGLYYKISVILFMILFFEVVINALLYDHYHQYGLVDTLYNLVPPHHHGLIGESIVLLGRIKNYLPLAMIFKPFHHAAWHTTILTQQHVFKDFINFMTTQGLSQSTNNGEIVVLLQQETRSKLTHLVFSQLPAVLSYSRPLSASYDWLCDILLASYDAMQQLQQHPVELALYAMGLQRFEMSKASYGIFFALSYLKYLFFTTIVVYLICFQTSRRLYETYYVHVSHHQTSGNAKKKEEEKKATTASSTTTRTPSSQQHIAVTLAGLVYYVLVIATPLFLGDFGIFLYDQEFTTQSPLLTSPTPTTTSSSSSSAAASAATPLTIIHIALPIVSAMTGQTGAIGSGFEARGVVGNFISWIQHLMNIALYSSQNVSISLLNYIFSPTSLPHKVLQHITWYAGRVLMKTGSGGDELASMTGKSGNLVDFAQVDQFKQYIFTSTPANSSTDTVNATMNNITAIEMSYEEFNFIHIFILFSLCTLIVSIVLFFVSNYLQNRCHTILADLRKTKPTTTNEQQQEKQQQKQQKQNDKSKEQISPQTAPITTTKQYSIPTRGLFRYITCPHYTMEVVIYFSIFCLQPLSIHLFTMFSSLRIALCSFTVFENNDVLHAVISLSLILAQMLFSPFLLCVVWVWSNLYITALNTHRWYLSTFGTAYAKLNKGVLFPNLCSGCGSSK